MFKKLLSVLLLSAAVVAPTVVLADAKGFANPENADQTGQCNAHGPQTNGTATGHGKFLQGCVGH
jgi:hypothetical protein